MGRVAVGVSVPEEDELARQVVAMISSLESVGSVCDFQYMDRESCLRELKNGNLYAVLDVPEGFVRDIMRACLQRQVFPHTLESSSLNWLSIYHLSEPLEFC